MVVRQLLALGLAPFLSIGMQTGTAAAEPFFHPFAGSSRPDHIAGRDQILAANELAQTFVSTWNRRDGSGYGEAYWPDAELVDPSGQIWLGRKAIIDTHVDLWAGPARATHMAAHVRRVRALSPTLFVVDIDTSATGFSPPPPGASNGVVQTRLKHVVEKRNGMWKIVTSQNTFVSR